MNIRVRVTHKLTFQLDDNPLDKATIYEEGHKYEMKIFNNITKKP